MPRPPFPNTVRLRPAATPAGLICLWLAVAPGAEAFPSMPAANGQSATQHGPVQVAQSPRKWRRLIGGQGLQVMVPADLACDTAGPVDVLVRTSDRKIFQGDRAELQRTLAGARAALTFECPGMTAMNVTGELRGQTVLRAVMAGDRGWALAENADAGQAVVREAPAPAFQSPEAALDTAEAGGTNGKPPSSPALRDDPGVDESETAAIPGAAPRTSAGGESAEPLGSAGIQVTDGFVTGGHDLLSALLLYKANPDDLEKNPHRYARLVPDVFARHADTRFDINSSHVMWRGRNQFDREDSQRAFNDEAKPLLDRLVPAFPIDVSTDAKVYLDPYDSKRGSYEIRFGFYSGLSNIGVIAPYGMIRYWDLPREDARRIDGLKDDRRRAIEQAVKETNPTADAKTLALLLRNELRSFDGSSHLIFRTKYRINDIRTDDRRGGLPVLVTALHGIEAYSAHDMERPVASIPLPEDAVLVDELPAGREAAPADLEVVHLDPEVIRLYMVRQDPSLLEAPDFVASSLALRRQIEVSATRKCGERPCAPVNWPGLLPTALVRSNIAPEQRDIDAYRQSMRTRAAKLPEILRFSEVCKISGACQQTSSAKEPGKPVPINISLKGILAEKSEGAGNLTEMAKTVVPELQGAGILGDNPGWNGMPYFLAAYGDNVAWFENGAMAVPPTAPRVDADFRIGKAGFVSDARGRKVLVAALEPVKLYVTGLDGTVEERILDAPPSGSASTGASDEGARSRFDVMGVKLGMPLEEAAKMLRGALNGMAFQEVSREPSSGGAMTPCQGAGFRVEREQTSRLAQLDHEKKNEILDHTLKMREQRMREQRQEGEADKAEMARITGEIEARYRIEADRHKASFGEAKEAALRKAGCPVPSETPVNFAFGVEIDHGEFKEKLFLYGNGESLGSPMVTAVYREVQQRPQLLSEGLMAKYGDDRLSFSSAHSTENYWLEDPSMRVKFLADESKTGCRVFWPVTAYIPTTYHSQNCGSFIRESAGRMILIDTRYAAATKEAASKAAEDAVEEKKKPALKF